MELHLINGFLGSGKTTAIIAAAKIGMQQGQKVSIITNDKGRFQVDAAFFQSNLIPTRQVTGGCFRCSFDEFKEKIAQLQASDSPDVIFAESVGSCVDLVNTIFGPIQLNTRLDVSKTTYTVFADARLFRRWIAGEPLPFSDHILYLFAKQIEESKLLILNKSDLLPPDTQQKILAAAAEKFPRKQILLQNSLGEGGVLPWLDALAVQNTLMDRPGFVVDYPKYKSGENEMAWFDAKIVIESDSPGTCRPALVEIVRMLLAEIQRNAVVVGHLKFFISSPGAGTKLSFTTADLLEVPQPQQWASRIPDIPGLSLAVMVNGRAAGDAGLFEEILSSVFDRAGQLPQVRIRSEAGSSYNPEMSMNRPKKQEENNL